MPWTLTSALLKLLAKNTCCCLPEGFCCESLFHQKAGQAGSPEKLTLLKAALDKWQKKNYWCVSPSALSSPHGITQRHVLRCLLKFPRGDEPQVTTCLRMHPLPVSFISHLILPRHYQCFLGILSQINYIDLNRTLSVCIRGTLNLDTCTSVSIVPSPAVLLC